MVQLLLGNVPSTTKAAERISSAVGSQFGLPNQSSRLHLATKLGHARMNPSVIITNFGLQYCQNIAVVSTSYSFEGPRYRQHVTP
eukprot:4766457-Amphidinium_carterae.1